jgi:UDP-N-acetylmuramyl pentapeptide phosphotransferase/UDP-N-acetylglucosamine-1-phosphate transferase
MLSSFPFTDMTKANREYLPMKYFFSLFLSLSIMLVITPKLRKLAYKIDYLEKPNESADRKIHKEAKPYLAGLGYISRSGFAI